MKKTKYILLLFMTIALAGSAWSQQSQARLEINYVAGMPTGNFRNITDKVSGRGAELSLLFPVSGRLSFGLQTGYQDFYQKYPRQVFAESGYALSAVVTNSVQVTPIMAKARYRASTTGTIQPFVSLAAGGNLISYRKFYGEFVETKTGFGFAAQPSAGIHVPLGAAGRSGFNLAAGYNIMPFKYNDADGLNHAVIKAGFSFNLR